MLQRLDRYLPSVSSKEIDESSREGSKQPLVFKPETPANLGEAYLVSVAYDGEKRLAYAKLYEPTSHKIFFWYDNKGHKPYCLSDQPIEDLEKNDALVRHEGFDHFETLEKYDALRDRRVKLTKIVAKDPLSIGGRPVGCIRDLVRAWEADIRYVENYIYDTGLQPGMPYGIDQGKLIALDQKHDQTHQNVVKSLVGAEQEEYRQLSLEWIHLLECPVPELRRVALDIEVYSPVATRIPIADEAEHEILCASLYGSDGQRKILLLRRTGAESRSEDLPDDVKVEYCNSEEELLIEIFRALLDYPVVLTFNGDDFDMRYLYHRAQRLGFNREQIPIELGRDAAQLTYGIHIDLYKFFFNRSIQVYAFAQRYRETTLDEIGESIVGLGKREIEAPVSELTYSELSAYCFRDAEIVMKLSSFNDTLVMKLIVALSRISYMPIEDVTRQGVSGWIRSMIYNEHRRRGYLIPRSDDILEMKGTTTTEAVIKGKKYKGAIVVEPVPGVHFNVSVLDFASLYPSIIKTWNLGYETILCPHDQPECRENKVYDTAHWICRKKKSLGSLLIGSLRDLRVGWYKPKSKDSNLSPQVRSWYNVVQNALKVVLNASYGVFGADKFALYCPPVAEATAAIGRYAMTQTIDKASSLGMKVFYGDTDSIFLGSPNLQQLDNLIQWSKTQLGMELEVDKNYRYLALSSRKKNYLGVYMDGNVDIKGLTGKKRHMPAFLKRAFYEMVDTLSQVKSGDEFEAAKQKIRQIVRECYLGLRNRKFPLEDLAFGIMISKPPERYVKTTPQHVKAAQLLAQRGIEVKPGDIVPFVKVIGEPGVKPIQFASLSDVDSEKYLEYVHSTFDQVLDSMGIDFNEIIGMTKLETYFS